MRALALIVLFAACQHEAREPAASRPPPDAGDSPCVTQCIHDHQMQATSQEHIRAGCVAECAPPSP